MEDLKWFIGFLVIIVIVWFTGRSISSTRTSQTASTTAQSQGTGSPKSIPERRTDTQAKATEPRQTAAQTQTDTNASNLQGALSIISLARSQTPEEEYVTIQASPQNSAPVIITGLTLESGVTHLTQTLPKAWALPYLDAPGEGDLAMLRPGERAYLISGRSPIAMSFQENTCTGFFEGAGLRFSPSIPIACPAPTEEPLPEPPNALSDACYDYLGSIPRCTVPSKIPDYLSEDGACQAHVFHKINYTQCVNYHKNELDFYGGEWHLYFGRSSGLWRNKNEVVELRDTVGKLIDSKTF